MNKAMEDARRSRIVRHIQARFGTEPEYLWAQYPNYIIFRHPASKKWFAVIMDVPENKLGLPGAASIDILNIRCDPRMTGSLLAETGFLPAYHMSKSTWISILLNGSAPDDTIIPLLEFSYDSVAPKRRKR